MEKKENQEFNTIPETDLVITNHQEKASPTGTKNTSPETSGNESVPSEPATVKQGKKRESGVHPSLLILLAVIILGVLAGGFFLIRDMQQKQAEAEALAEQQALEEQTRQEQQALEIKYSRIMHSGLYPDGVSVDGINLSGLNQPEAQAKISGAIQSHDPKGKISLTYGDKKYDIDFSSYVKVTNDSDSVLKAAMTAAQDEDMETAIKKAEDLKTNGKDFEITYETDCSALKDAVSKIASEIDRKAVSASFTNIDKENHTAETSGAIVGLEVRQDELYEALVEAYETGSSKNIDIPVTETVPKSSREDFSIITLETKTSFQGSNENRKFNIRKGCDIINGTILIPGEVFSMNDTLGIREHSSGWKDANAYVSGTHELQAGGGVCQISTTLYNTAVKADLEIVTRKNHSMPVGYIGMGLDATIQSVGFIIDMQFKNNTDSDVLLFTWTEGNVLYARILRSPFETDEFDEIRLTSEKIQDLEPEGDAEYVLDETLGYGQTVTDVARRKGSIWQSYKHYYKNGNKVRTEPLAKSTYKAFNGNYRVGPAFPEGYYKDSGGSGTTEITVG